MRPPIHRQQSEMTSSQKNQKKGIKIPALEPITAQTTCEIEKRFAENSEFQNQMEYRGRAVAFSDDLEQA